MGIGMISRLVYALFGAGFLAAGSVVLLLTTGLLPHVLEDTIRDFARGDPNTLHITQEFGSMLVFAGLITFWFVRHYEQSMPFHWAMTTFWGLFAAIHWFDPSGSFHAGSHQIINTVPFLLFVLLGLLRSRKEKWSSR